MYNAVNVNTNCDGWKTSSDGVYSRPDGTTFQVPLKTYNGICGTYSSYGGYTQEELQKFSEDQK